MQVPLKNLILFPAFPIKETNMLHSDWFFLKIGFTHSLDRFMDKNIELGNRLPRLESQSCLFLVTILGNLLNFSVY